MKANKKMHSVKSTRNAASTDEVIETIFNACRANELRNEFKQGAYAVSFKHEIADIYRATVKRDGVVIGSALVDKFDC